MSKCIKYIVEFSETLRPAAFGFVLIKRLKLGVDTVKGNAVYQAKTEDGLMSSFGSVQIA